MYKPGSCLRHGVLLLILVALSAFRDSPSPRPRSAAALRTLPGPPLAVPKLLPAIKRLE